MILLLAYMESVQIESGIGIYYLKSYKVFIFIVSFLSLYGIENDIKINKL